MFSGFVPMGAAFLNQGSRGQGAKLTIKLHLVLRLRMNATILILYSYGLIACT